MKYIRHYLICKIKKTRIGPLQGYLAPMRKSSTPFEILHADILGPLPVSQNFKYISVLVDAFTKYCLLCPLKSTTAK